MLGSLLSRVIIIGCGLLYPAYSSFKTIRSANVKHYVRWMMYWTVFALFSAAEWVADFWISWLPFYYEIKVLLVIWLMSSYTKGASIIYRKVLLDAGRKGVQAAAGGALAGVGVLQTQAEGQGMTAASGLMGSLMNMASNVVTTSTQRATPSQEDADETFETIDDTEIISSSDEEDDEEHDGESDEDGDYEPPTTRRTRSSKKKD